MNPQPAAARLLPALCGAGFVGLILSGLPGFLGVHAPLANCGLAVLVGLAVGTRLLRWPTLLVLAVVAWRYQGLGATAWRQLRFVAVAWRSGANPQLPALAGYLLLALIALGLALIFRRDRPLGSVAVGLCLLALEWEFLDEAARQAVWPALALALAWFAAVGPAGRLPRNRPGWTAPFLAGLCVLSAVGAAWLLPLDRPPGGLGKLGIWVETRFPTLLRIEGATRFGPAGSGTGPERYGNPDAPPAVPYGLALTGFAQDDSRLGGPLQSSAAEALRVKVAGDAPAVLYLRGATRDTYTGEGWVSSPGSRKPLPSPRAAFGRPFPGRAYTVTIDQSELITSNLFTLLRPVAVEAPFTHPWDELGNTWVPDPLPPGTTYAVRVVTPTSAPAATRFGFGPGNRPGYRFGYGSGYGSGYGYGSGFGYGYGFRYGFRPANAAPPANYLQLPAELPPRVAALARTWTAGAHTPQAKANALMAHLSRIPYSLNAPAAPPGRDFVDFFLFTARQGYCTYYSSALAVMLRTLGIPSRWVEGFRIHTPPPGQQAVVHDSDAHAWVEAWLGPAGWVTLDPTPWGPTLRPESVAATASTPATAAAATPEGAAQGTEPPRAAGGPAGRHPWAWWLAAVALVLAGRIAWRAWRERWMERRPVDSARRLWRSFEHLVPRRAGQTPLELARQLAAAQTGLGEPALHLAAAYGRLRYGPEGERTAAAVEVRHAWRQLDAAWRRDKGWRYLWRRWVA